MAHGMFSILYGLYMKLKEWKDGFFACLFLSVTFLRADSLLEFMKANPDLALGLSRTQWLSVPMILIGLGGLIYLNRQAIMHKIRLSQLSNPSFSN